MNATDIETKKITSLTSFVDTLWSCFSVPSLHVDSTTSHRNRLLYMLAKIWVFLPSRENTKLTVINLVRKGAVVLN